MSETYTHLTLSERIEIERMLSVCSTVTEIADALGYARQSIVREIMRNRTDEGRAKAYGRNWNGCVHQRRCELRHVCGWENCNRTCSRCKNVNCVASCPDFEANSCPQLARPPYVCNGCPAFRSCAYPRLSYHAKAAQARADELRSASRRGVDLSEDEAAIIVSCAKPMLDNGLSPATIWEAHGDKMPCSERSFYRYVHNCVIDGIRTIDLPAAVGYRQRRQGHEPTRTNISAEALKGRTYADFLLLPDAVRARGAEIDCVMGIQDDGCCLLTLFFRAWAFQPVFLLPKHTAWSVVWTLMDIEHCLGSSFPDPLLADRGCEFADAEGIEGSELLADRKCHLYYCDPRRSDQKARCENAHRLIRRILPKGTSFEGLDDEAIALVSSHVNSMPRASLDGKPPLLLAMQHLPKEFFEHFSIRLIPADEIVLKPKLLGL